MSRWWLLAGVWAAGPAAERLCISMVVGAPTLDDLIPLAWGMRAADTALECVGGWGYVVLGM